MKKVAKILTTFLLFSVAIIFYIVSTTSKLKAAGLSNDEILMNANFSKSVINSLSDYTKEELVKQIQCERDFRYEIMTLAETNGNGIRPMGQIPDDDLLIIITTSIHKIQDNKVKEIKVKVYYEWTDLPMWRLEDPIIVAWDSEKFFYESGSFYSEDRYSRDGDHLHVSRYNYYQKNLDTLCWYTDLKAGYFLGIGGTIKSLYGFGEFILNVKDDYQDYGTSFIETTYVHSKVQVEAGISIYAEIGFSVPTSGNDQVATDITFNWNTPFLLTQADYGFEQQYFFYEKSQTIKLQNLTFETTRLRCGYIEEEYIVLSPRRDNAGIAYLVYSFENNVQQISVDLTMWSVNENFNESDSSALIQYKDKNGNWITILDLLNDVILSKDRTNPNNYIIIFPKDINEFRFYCQSVATGDRNKGRVCIGNMEIYLEH